MTWNMTSLTQEDGFVPLQPEYVSETRSVIVPVTSKIQMMQIAVALLWQISGTHTRNI